MASNQEYNEKNITVLEGLEAVRKRPGMYIGSTGTKGLNHLVYEILDNAVDEHLAGYCNQIKVTLNADGSCTVEDNGRGIPVGMHDKGMPAARLIFTTLHAGGKFDNNAYKASGGLHGVGSSVVNALSCWMDVEISREGFVHHDRYEKGIPVEKLENKLLPKIRKTNKTGTKISFLPDHSIFEKTKFKEEDIKSKLHETAYLNPKLTITFEDKITGEKEIFHEEDGLIGFVKDLNKEETPIHDVLYFSGKVDNIEVEVALQYTNSFRENTLGFCNNIYNAEGGTHITGFKNALTATLNQYARQIGVLKEKDDNFTGAEIRTGLSGAVVAIRHPSPRFEGQTKTKLDNAECVKAVSQITAEQLTLHFDRNLDELKQVLSCAEKAAKVRKTEERAKKSLISQSKWSLDDNGKLANCESKDAERCEIFIVEGDSAGGSAKTARDRKYQAVLPLRGKILNVEKANTLKVFENEEIQTMLKAFACGVPGSPDFDVNKLRYGKIILMTDADVDGAHIDTLGLTFFFRLLPELISTGHVYLAQPPLYKAIPKRGEAEYLYDDLALEKYRKTHKDFTLQRYKGLGEMDADQLWETTMNPKTRRLKRVQIEDPIQAEKKTSLLMGTNVESRKEYIQKHAKMYEG